MNINTIKAKSTYSNMSRTRAPEMSAETRNMRGSIMGVQVPVYTEPLDISLSPQNTQSSHESMTHHDDKIRQLAIMEEEAKADQHRAGIIQKSLDQKSMPTNTRTMAEEIDILEHKMRSLTTEYELKEREMEQKFKNHQAWTAEKLDSIMNSCAKLSESKTKGVQSELDRFIAETRCRQDDVMSLEYDFHQTSHTLKQAVNSIVDHLLVLNTERASADEYEVENRAKELDRIYFVANCDDERDAAIANKSKPAPVFTEEEEEKIEKIMGTDNESVAMEMDYAEAKADVAEPGQQLNSNGKREMHYITLGSKRVKLEVFQPALQMIADIFSSN